MNSFNSFSSKMKAKMEEAKKQVEQKIDERRKNIEESSGSEEEQSNSTPNRRPSNAQ